VCPAALQVGDDDRGYLLELLLTKLRFAVATSAAAAAGEPGVEPPPGFDGNLQVQPAGTSESCFTAGTGLGSRV